MKTRIKTCGIHLRLAANLAPLACRGAASHRKRIATSPFPRTSGGPAAILLQGQTQLPNL